MFPNFIRRACFRGRVFAIGNAASFLEPLEATAITTTLYQLNLVETWIASMLLDQDPTDQLPGLISERVHAFVRRVGYFVSWHYAMGSPYETPFWKAAEDCFREAWEAPGWADVRQDFEAIATDAAALPVALAEAEDRQSLTPLEPESESTLGGFLLDSYAKVGHGTGYFSP